ncbi:MAG: DNA translocase FtsK [Candidatus Niyogibacteria bacterium]|nr:DNA translocase FtsK [Candidatus Niyogibacteria bacterium]
MLNVSLKFRWPFGKKDEAAGGEGTDPTTAEKFKAAFDAIKGELTRERVQEEMPQAPESEIESEVQEGDEGSPLLPRRKLRPAVAFKPPPLDLLEDDKGRPNSGDIKANANIIKRTLQNFGIVVEMAEVNIGPSITQYTMRPAEGVKLSKITGLHNDLALALAAHPIRIEAPIPGKSLVGIEIPNRSIALVGMRSMLASEDFRELKGELALSLGRDVSGRTTYAVLEKMPHLLIAGSTGSGKSVAIHVMMMSLLYRNPPERLRFLMIDPKRVELSVYSGIPHNLTPVITDPKKAILALKWATREMERRYECLAKHKARDIGSYHAIPVSAEEPMPYIVIVIDELADIMTAYPREMEAAVVRLAQMSRAVGIHLVLSTQRPSVEVITGLIKANITSRIAFQVASQVDSRTILDMAGAEKLLGKGDMLFMSGDSAKPRRIQGAFVSESEVRKVAQYLENTYSASEAESLSLEAEAESGTMFGDAPDGDADDDLYEEAKTIVVGAGKASASYLQRRLRIGYARAARLLDILESRGVIGPGEGAKPREVLVKADETVLAASKEAAKKEEDKNFFESF